MSNLIFDEDSMDSVDSGFADMNHDDFDFSKKLNFDSSDLELLEKDSFELSPPRVEQLTITGKDASNSICSSALASFAYVSPDFPTDKNSHTKFDYKSPEPTLQDSFSSKDQRRRSSLYRCRTSLFSTKLIVDDKLTSSSPSLDRLSRLSCLAPVTIASPNKRQRKSEDFSSITNAKKQKINESQRSIQRHKSEVIVKKAMDRSLESENLTADFTRKLYLPVEAKVSKNSDLNSISASTMHHVKNGKYPKREYLIIDCRYPFEYDAGHIKSAVNWYTKEMIMDNLIRSQVVSANTILIFHCEFSSERGPKMSRFLRNMDREMNAENYPSLNYPEVYILKDGYKSFYEHNTEFCIPAAYCPMLHPGYKNQLRLHRSLRKQEKRQCKRKL